MFKDEFPATQKRDRRELLTLCTVLDLCAKGKSLEAADVAAQRVKALCMVNDKTSTWQQAQYQELIPPDDRHNLVNASDYATVQKESEAFNKLKGLNSSANYWRNEKPEYQRDWKDKSKGKEKGKGKGKNKGKMKDKLHKE